MALPTDRQSFKDYCTRALGAPVINVDVPDVQLDDRVDEALQFYRDYHWDGTSKVYYAHQMTQTDLDNGYVDLPSEITGAVSIFDVGTAISASGGMFSIQYQIALNDLYAFSGVDLIPFWMTFENLQFIEQIIVGKQPIRYNRNDNRLFIDMDMNKIGVDQYIMVEAFQTVDPTVHANVWKDRWLLKYATALIKRQWGNNIKKFSGVNMPGGVTFNGQQIYDEADEEVNALEEDMKQNSMTVAMIIG